jgi:hypothetical protein
MTKKLEQDDYPPTWPAWCVKIGKALEAAEEASGAELEEKGEPPWVDAIGSEVVKYFVPTIRKLDFKDHGPLFIGKLLGHQRTLLKGENGLEKQLTRHAKRADEVDKLMRQKLNRRAYARWHQKALRWHAKYGAAWYSVDTRWNRVVKLKLRVISQGLKAAIDQPESEHAEFHRGYFEALGKELFDEQGNAAHEKLTSTTNIYMLMVVYWRWVRQLPSIPALHRFLCAVLGERQVGDIARTKGICRRFGIRLAPRGRPRKKR